VRDPVGADDASTRRLCLTSASGMAGAHPDDAR
jgi:hypothetical protein